ncbi:hypothetical protein NITHO_500015 [Nitrolancea hollandica Lb]|uniref:Uncharacterized protein n=1 Tax=Nitrolancea hollandica Lb TaxID=1129897 RepID=I4ELB8_9BACT|nr:hypothetical protein NITHO_500015 [Nitrolancea hollandica Lb]
MSTLDYDLLTVGEPDLAGYVRFWHWPLDAKRGLAVQQYEALACACGRPADCRVAKLGVLFPAWLS